MSSLACSRRSTSKQRGECHDRRTVLVVVEDRDVEQVLEPLLDLEAARGRDVLEVDAAEARRHPHDRLDDLVDVGGVEADRDRVDATELLEQDRLALHDRHGGCGPDVAEPEDGGAVGDHRDGVGDPGVVVDQVRLGGDRLAHLGDARGVGQGQVHRAVERDGRGDLHLAARVQLEDGRARARTVLGGRGRGSHEGNFRCRPVSGGAGLQHLGWRRGRRVTGFSRQVSLAQRPDADAAATTGRGPPPPRRGPAPPRPSRSPPLRRGCRAPPTNRRAPGVRRASPRPPRSRAA